MSFKEIYQTMLKEYPDVLNVTEMSKALGVSVKTGYRLLKKGTVKSFLVGRSYRIPKIYIFEYLGIVEKSSA